MYNIYIFLISEYVQSSCGVVILGIEQSNCESHFGHRAMFNTFYLDGRLYNLSMNEPRISHHFSCRCSGMLEYLLIRSTIFHHFSALKHFARSEWVGRRLIKGTATHESCQWVELFCWSAQDNSHDVDKWGKQRCITLFRSELMPSIHQLCSNSA